MAARNPVEKLSKEGLVLPRVLDAPRDLVFKAWIDPKQLAQWWGPHGFTNPVCELDVRPGGAIRIDMRAPDGTVYPMTGRFQEIVEPERLVFTNSALDPARKPLFEVLTTVTFVQKAGKTTVTTRARVVKQFTTGAAPYPEGMEEGWTQTLERLEAHMARGGGAKGGAPKAKTGTREPGDSSEREVLITRVFDAPRELVFRAWTDPASLQRWYAPRGCTVRFVRIDPRQGGTFHSCIGTPDGHDCWCTGAYREIVPPQRIVYTLAVANEKGDDVEPADAGMDPAWPRETVVTVKFAERDGKTTVTLHQTVSEALAKRTGAHPSWIQMMDRLAEDLAHRSGGAR